MTRYCCNIEGDLEKKFLDKIYEKTKRKHGSIQEALIESVELYVKEK